MTTASSTAVPTLIGSVQRALRLLEAVGTHRDGAPAKQLAREAGLPLPTAYHLLRTLTHEGYLRRENGVFLFGAAAENLTAARGSRSRPSTVTDSLAHWRDAIGVPVYCAVYREGEIELIAVADAPTPPRWTSGPPSGRPGTRMRSGSAFSASSTRRTARITSTGTPYGPSLVTQCEIARLFWRGCGRCAGVNRSSNARSTHWGPSAPPFPSQPVPPLRRWPFPYPWTGKNGYFPQSNSYVAKWRASCVRSCSLSVSEKSLLVICYRVHHDGVNRAMGIIPGQFHLLRG